MEDDNGAVRELKPASTSAFRYPFAASPDIIRSNQKDAYFQAVLLEQLGDIVRKIYGSRFLHNYTTEARTAADLLYYGLTTLVGNRTLGEEYCDIVQVEDDTLRLPAISRRAGYILTTILLPYGLNRVLPAFRRRVRAKLESTLARQQGSSEKGFKTRPTRTTVIQQYILNNLDTITSPAPVYAVSLATFYFSGAYYHLSKRIWGLRYIFTRQLTPADQRVGYEVLGVLLVLQLGVQSYMHFHETVASEAGNELTIANSASAAGTSAMIDGGVEVSLDPNSYAGNNALLFESGPANTGISQRITTMTNTPPTTEDTPRYDLANKDVMRWLANKQTRKCTLCLEPMKDPSATTCGHTKVGQPLFSRCSSRLGVWLVLVAARELLFAPAPVSRQYLRRNAPHGSLPPLCGAKQ
ncbi:hypothetical protein FH972_021508 [Carpinus fangiana]|uniref:RING-type E3 ubiquitin transferase n=1 Tax=Carpinus fangiana TaxID=176857 RepID=A0A5N6KPW4_9ROSI|nr:hypothetical protein FH972_021508 [Carpinus fangiana]